jgi:predicted transcriptional regulator
MQTLAIMDESKKESILEAVSDRYSRIILEATMSKPKTALEISTEYGIPISTVYRRLQALHDAHIVGISGSISADGKKYFMYKSKLRSVSTSFDGNKIEISIIPNVG